MKSLLTFLQKQESACQIRLFNYLVMEEGLRIQNTHIELYLLQVMSFLSAYLYILITIKTMT